MTEPATAEDPIPVLPDDAPLRLDGDGVRQALVAIVPTHRRDLQIEADIAEEVARVRGYENLPGKRPDTLMPPYRPDPWRDTDTLRQLLSGRGLAEVVAAALISTRDHERVGFAADDPQTIRAANPVSADHAELRRTLLPGLLRVLGDNERQRRENVQIFELGSVHTFGPDGPAQHPRLGILLAGSAQPPSFDTPPRSVDILDLKGLLETIVGRLAPGAHLRYAAASPRPNVDHPGRSATVLAEMKSPTPSDEPIQLGLVAEAHPALIRAWDIRTERPLFAEIDLDALLALVPRHQRVDEVDRLPALERDIAIVVSEDAPAGDIAAAIRQAAGEQLSDLWLFDRYAGAPLKPREVSLGFRLRFQPAGELTSEEDLDGTIERVVRVLEAAFGGRLRA
jgi:phenylalanyl-tRNA synthetase beta chain